MQKTINREEPFTATALRTTRDELDQNIPSNAKAPRNAKRPRGALSCETRPPGGRRPTLPRGLPRSTLGAGGLNFRVRYGTGCAPAAPAARPGGAFLHAASKARPAGRRRPTLPRGLPRSTLGAGGLNFRVRYGTGCAPAAPAAGPRAALLAFAPVPLRAPWGPHGAGGKRLERPLSSGRAPRRASPGPGPVSGARLRRSRALHLRPIDQVFSLGPRVEGASRGGLRA